jgi:hypothetical protein
MSQHIPLTQLPPDTKIAMTPRQVHEHCAMVIGKSVAAYHEEYHQSRWKKIAKRVAAEVQSFKTAVNEQYGKDHERGQLAWQRFAGWVADFLYRLRHIGAAVASLEAGPEDEIDTDEEGEAAIRHVDKRAGRR